LVTFLFAGIAFAQGNPVTGNDWLKVNKNARIQLVNDFIKAMKKEGVTISKSAQHYCEKVDKVLAKHPNALPAPVWKTLKTAMIMDNDWKVRGQDPDKLAKDWLGDKLYIKWKEKQAKAK
jgi:hypothetical protein